MDSIDQAVSRCPFLHNVALTQGRAVATSIACNPLLPASSASVRRPILEEQDDFAATFRLFHGSGGIVPLVRSVEPQPLASPCIHAVSLKHDEPPPVSRTVMSAAKDQSHHASRNPIASAPLAAMSFGMVCDMSCTVYAQLY